MSWWSSHPVVWLTDLAPFAFGAVAWQLAQSKANQTVVEQPVLDQKQRVFGAIAQSVLESSLDGLILVGTDDKVQFVNAAVERIFGHSREGCQMERKLLPHPLFGEHARRA